MLKVVKLGGNELDQPEWLAACGVALKAVEPLVVVHGGGRAVSALSERLGLPVEKRGGLRVTSPEIAEVVETVMGGPANRLVVEALRRAGLDAIGLSGSDGGLLTAAPLPELGHVGEIVAVRTGLLDSLLLAGFTPVIAPMAPGPEGGLPFNVNADQAAAAIAGELGAAELLFVSNVTGVRVDGVTQASLATSEIEPLIAAGVAADGMAAKLRAAALALATGAQAVRVGDLAMLADPAAGTRILPHLAARVA